MAMQPGQYQAHYGSNKEKSEIPEEPDNLYRRDGTRSQTMTSEPPYPSDQGIPYDASAIPQSLRHLIFTKADGGLRISDISLQTGEEFALGFSQEASRAQRELASRRNVSNADWTIPHATYADSRDILGFRRMDSGANSDKSYKAGGGEVDGNSGSLYSEPPHDMQIPLSFKATVDQKSDGGFAAYSAKPMKYSQMSRSSSHRSSFSEASRGSSVKKIKLMCSFGGKFLPRPKDGKLRYVGGDTHIISITKDISYDSLVQKISDIYGQGFILKYQLPGEELDSLVSVSCDEDLENMMDEFEKMEEQNGSCKLRIFLFDSYDHDLVHYNVLADRRNSEQLYVDAVNRIAQSSSRKQSGSIGSLTGQHSGNLIGLDLAEDVSGKKTNECFPELSFYQSTSDVQSVPLASTSQTLSQNPVISNIHYVSQAPIISSPFLSMPSSIEHIESVDAPHLFPEKGVEPDFQSCNVSSTLQDNHFKSYEHPLHEMMHEVTDFGASEEQLGNQTEALNPNFSISSSHNWRDFDTVFSSYPPHEVQMPQVYDPRQYGMHTIAGDHVSDWMFVSQALHQVHRHTDRQYADVNQYGILHHDYSPSNYENPKIAPPLSHVAESFHYEQPHSTYFESADGSSNYMVQQSCNNTLEDLQSDRSAGKINSVIDTYNHKNSSPPPNIPSDGLETKEQNDINVSKNNQEICKPTEQSEMGELREPKENLQFNKAFYPSEMHYPSCQSAEQNLSPKEPAPENKDLNFHNISGVNTSLIDPQKASQQSSIPHVHSDTVLQTYSKSSGSMNEDIFPSPSHRSESSLTVMSSDRRPDLSEDQTLCMQSNKDIGNETSSTGCISNINHTTFSEQLPGHVSHQSGQSSQDPSGLESRCEDSDGFNLYLQQKAFVQNHKATRTRMCQSEGDEDEKVSDLIGDSYGNRSTSFNSFDRAKFSETLHTFLPPNLDETFQAYSKVKNLECPSEDAEHKDFPNHGTRNTENQSTDDIEEQLADSLIHSPSKKQGVASSENLTEIVDRDNKGHVDESHAVSFGSETWWTKATSASMDCKVDSSHFDLGKTESLDPSSLTTDNDMNKAPYHATPSFVKSLIDDDIVEAYDDNGTFNSKDVEFAPSSILTMDFNSENDGVDQTEEDFPSRLLSRSLMEETSDSICSNGFSTKLKVTEAAFANTDIHDNLDSPSKDHFLGSGEDKASIVIPSLKIDSALTTEREWEVVSTSATAGNEMLQGKAMEAVEEESVAAQYSDTEETKIEDSDKDEPYCDAAIEEATKRGLQVIKNADLEELRELGCGTFGTVFYGKWRGSDVAIKRIKNSCFIGTPSMQGRMRAEFWREACILAQLHHPNVVAFYGVVPDGPGGTLATVTEYMVNGSLKQVLQRRDRSIDRRKRWLITMDAAFGMEYLHSKNIVHFDLKCENLLVNMRDSQRPICKVGDLGLSKVKQHTLVSGGVRGTLPWMAPELLNGSSSMVSEKVDVFSFGIVMWELLTGEEPYANMHYGAIIGGIVNNTLRPHVPNWCDSQWRALMEQCWSADPGVRPTFTEIANRLRSTANSFHPKGHSHTVQMHYG